MPSPAPNTAAERRIVILGTGGTISGEAPGALDAVGYEAGRRSAAELLGGLPLHEVLPSGLGLEVRQLAQIDSKDMDLAIWSALAHAVSALLADAQVQAVVITHGTDTLEETGYLLHRLLAPARPVVLTAAMRPASSIQADGPQNLIDALQVACLPQAAGVLAVLGGEVLAGAELRKRHPMRLQPFSAGDAGPIGVVEAGRWRGFRPWPQGQALGLRGWPDPERSQPSAARWPWVEVLSSHAAADPRAIEALTRAGVQGLVLAATGNGTLHQALVPAVEAARAAGVLVWTASRCGDGCIIGPAADSPAAALTPWQARVELILHLMANREGPDDGAR